MSTNSKIEWTDATWNFVRGCTRISDGCLHCYIDSTPPFRMARNFFDSPAIGGKTRISLHPDKVSDPLSWRAPRRVFVNSLSDLFHEDVPEPLIAKAFAVMAATPQHSYQILSKRPARMRSILGSLEFQHLVAREVDALAVDQAHSPIEKWLPIPGFEHYEASSHGRIRGANGILKPSLNPVTGRDAVSLWTNNTPKTMTVHRLVLIAHSPTSDESLQVCHRNGDKSDNRLANLRWGTHSENQKEKVRHGSRGGPQKISAAIAQAIRNARKGGLTQQAVADEFGVSRPLVSMIEHGHVWAQPDIIWPLPNVWLGVSAENQQWADIRIPMLLETPAAVRFVSAEPLLGPVDLRRLSVRGRTVDALGGDVSDAAGVVFTGTPSVLDWVIVGGESGRKARPMDTSWAAAIVDQCATAHAQVFVKQLGSVWAQTQGAAHPKGGDWDEWPEALRVRRFPLHETWLAAA